MDLSRFEQFWLAEHQRLRDVRDPLLQQQQLKLSEIRAHEPQNQLIERAVGLSERQGLLNQLRHWQHLRRLLTLLLGVLAVVIGIGVSQTILSQPQPLSLLFAINILLLPNLLMLLFWLAFTLRKPRPSGITGVAYSLLTLLQRKRGESALEQSWLEHVQQQRLLQPLMAVATHGFWLLIAISSWLTLLLYLSFNDYSFQWATTILNAEQVASIAHAINILPQFLFSVQVPAITDSATNTTIAAQAGRWLTFCLLTYGVLPRALAALLAVGLFYRRTIAMKLDLQAEGYNAVVNALGQSRQQTNTVDADTDSDTAIQFRYADQGRGSYLLTLDYEAEPEYTTNAEQLGLVATYAEKQRMLQRLSANPSAHLQVRVAAQLTPDRSSIQYLAALAKTTQQLTVVLVCGSQATYLAQWQQQLNRYGVAYVVA
ncbi:DUF2868 domain-containing protein [Pseudidiomarina sp. CB1]|uniref:DUF2868 domain-containing protein n=1 Tax=Pseudidiomarina sp. CB1 TaxID=2972484 RepID=UPI002163CB3D|nr:DUF2868 domain-containing protein [Pseudidiomarina sp. CB1]